MGTEAVLVGRNIVRNLTSSSSYAIGNSTVMIGTGLVSDGMLPPPNNCTLVGQDACSPNATTTGEIKLGVLSVHNTCTIDVDQTTQLITDSLVNLETSPSSTTIRARDSATTHNVNLLCGS